jgi:hypothetical protein
MEPPQPLGAGKVLRRATPIDLRRALKLQQVPRLKIHEQERSSRFSHQIAQRVEVPVAAEIRDCQHVAVDADEARAPAAM